MDGDPLPLPEPPEISTLGQAVARSRLRAALLGEVSPVQVGRFVLQRQLGRGGMGTVWLARDEQLDRSVALKFLHGTADGEVGEQRLFREAQGLGRLSHANVIPVFDVGRHDGRVWIAMEYVPGRTLRAWAEEHPDPRDRLAAWLDAGRGLLAVHRAGLVHRDVKPDNVLMGDDGRVRLIDFGLVRALRDPEDEETKTGGAQTRGVPAATSVTDGSLTIDGQFLGTPAYAPPEQLDGQRVDARADQASFCACVWEALCNERVGVERWPQDAAALLAVPDGISMPRRVQRALSRGLQRDPEQRFDDMEALLAALQPRRGRWALAGAVTTGVLGIGLGLASAPGGEFEPPCLHTDQPLTAVWTSDRADAVAQRDPTLADALERWTRRWRDTARQVCEEVHVQQTRSETSLGPRRACLDASLDALAVTLDATLEVPAIPEGTARSSAVLLESPRVCLSEAVLEQDQPRPDQRSAISELQRRLFRLYVGLGEASVEDRRHAATEVRAEAEALGFAPMVGRAAYTQGFLAYLSHDAEAARAHYGEALDLGGDDPLLVVDAWAGLAKVALDLDLDTRRTAWLFDRRVHVLGALPEAAAHQAMAIHDQGRLRLHQGDLPGAERATREAASAFEQLDPLARWQHAATLRQLAWIVQERGRPTDAARLRSQARALELREDAPEDAPVPPTDRGLASLEQGLTQLEQGQLDAAQTSLERARVQILQAHGAGSLFLAQAHVTLSALGDARGQLEVSWRHASQADRIVREAGGPDHPDRIQSLSALGTVAYRQERFPVAVDLYERTLTIAEATLPPRAPELAWARSNLAEALHEIGQDQRAETMLRQAISALEQIHGPEHPELSIPVKGLGVVLRARGDLDGARLWLERALALLGDRPEHLVEAAQTRWALAQTLDALEQTDAALELARRARTDFQSLGPDFEPRHDEIADWISIHRPRGTTP